MLTSFTGMNQLTFVGVGFCVSGVLQRCLKRDHMHSTKEGIFEKTVRLNDWVMPPGDKRMRMASGVLGREKGGSLGDALSLLEGDGGNDFSGGPQKEEMNKAVGSPTEQEVEAREKY